MSDDGDDELQRRQRDVLSSHRLGVPVSPDAIDRIHAGARRRQQRRTGASALGAVAIHRDCGHCHRGAATRSRIGSDCEHELAKPVCRRLVKHAGVAVC